MKSLTLGKRIVLGFSALIAVTVGLGLVAFVQFFTVSRASEYLAHDPVPGTVTIIRIAAAFKENYALVEKHISAHDKPAVTAKIQGNKGKIDELIQHYDATITMPEDRAMFERFKEERGKFVTAFQSVLAVSSSGRTEEAIVAGEQTMDPAYQALSATLDQLIDFNQRNLNSGVARIDEASQHGKTVIIAGVGLALLLAMAVAFFITRSANRVLHEITVAIAAGAEQTSSAATQVSAASQSLAHGTSEQAASLEETSASMEELASMTKRNADCANEARQTATEARALADRGGAHMQTMQSTMQAIKAASDDITHILKTIDEIAFQTNILALNAAVEAARAGDHGLGFAVVAEEVRALAQRCANAARETASKIEHSAVRSQEGVAVSSEVARNFSGIQAQIQRLETLAGEIATASIEQNQGIGQVSTAMSQMDQVTQANAGNAEETAAAAEELNGQAMALGEAVQRLRALTGNISAADFEPSSDDLPSTSARKPAARQQQGREGSQHQQKALHAKQPAPRKAEKRALEFV